MSTPRPLMLRRLLGLLTLVLACTAAAIRYAEAGEVRWSLIAAGIFFACLGFANRKPTPPTSR